MPGFWDKFPDTNYHEINLDWFLKLAEYVKSTADTMNEWKQEHTAEYEELVAHVNAIQDWIDGLEEGDIPQVLLDGLKVWIDDNIEQIIGRNIKYVWFGLTIDGYFVAYMPESWQELWFDTVMNYEDEYYGHLLIKYDAYGLRKTAPYYSTEPGSLPIDRFWSKDELMPYIIEGDDVHGVLP